MSLNRTRPLLFLLLLLIPVRAQEDLNALYFSGDYERLIHETGAVLDRGDSALEVFSLKARAENQLGRTGDAIQTLEAARALYPEDVSLMRMLAVRYQEAGNMVRAREEYQRIRIRDSLDLSTWLQLARIASFRQDYQVAVHHLQKVLTLDSVNLDGLMLMGESMERLPNTSNIL
jgi:tetratricopeptide (TPR) repeat protein